MARLAPASAGAGGLLVTLIWLWSRLRGHISHLVPEVEYVFV